MLRKRHNIVGELLQDAAPLPYNLRKRDEIRRSKCVGLEKDGGTPKNCFEGHNSLE